MLRKAAAKIANLLAPSRGVETNNGISRFVHVRFFLPGHEPVTEVYDRLSANDMKAWGENERLYRCQIIGFSAEGPDHGQAI